MNQRQRREGQRADANGLELRQALKVEQAWMFVQVGATVGIRRRMHGNRGATPPAQVEQALHMIGMEMRQHDGIQAARREALVQIHQTSVDQHARVAMLDQRAAGPALVAGLVLRTRAGYASATIQRHAAGRAGAQKAYAHNAGPAWERTSATSASPASSSRPSLAITAPSGAVPGMAR